MFAEQLGIHSRRPTANVCSFRTIDVTNVTIRTLGLITLLNKIVTFSHDQDSRPAGCERNVSVSLMDNLLDNYILKANSCNEHCAKHSGLKTGTTN